MKIAATYTACGQVGESDYRTYHVTKIFDGSVTIDQLDKWAKAISGGKDGWQDLQLSSIEKDE